MGRGGGGGEGVVAIGQGRAGGGGGQDAGGCPTGPTEIAWGGGEGEVGAHDDR